MFLLVIDADSNYVTVWSNFEIGDLDFWRGEAYTKYFEHLDAQGGFYYERWGDAPVHSLGAALFANKDQIHWFKDIGYRHEPFQHCPQGEYHTRGKVSVPSSNSRPMTYSSLSSARVLSRTPSATFRKSHFVKPVGS